MLVGLSTFRNLVKTLPNKTGGTVGSLTCVFAARRNVYYYQANSDSELFDKYLQSK